MRKLKISKDLFLPLQAVTQRFAFLGRTGAGKSYNAGVLFEEFVEAKQQAVVADPNGCWSGIRSSANGKGPGLPVTIFGGEDADLPLDPSSGILVADLIIGERISAILDMSLFETDADEIRFMTAFADRLFRKNRSPMHFFIDEADTFAPESPLGTENVMLNRMARLAKRGRGRGIGLSLLSQRSAALSKRVLSQTEIMVALQTTDPRDRKAIKSWIEGKGTPEEQEMVLSTLASLGTGEAWVWSPAFLNLLKRMKFREKHTYDSGATPKVGMRRRAPKVLAPVDLDRLKKHMSETIEKAKQEDPKLLRAEIQRLKVELAKKPVPTPAKHAPAVVKAPIVKDRVVEVPALKKGEIKAIQKLIARVEKERSSLGWSTQSLEATANMLSQALGKSVDAVERVKRKPEVVFPRALTKSEALKKWQKAYPKAVMPNNGENRAELLAGERKMLEVLAQFHPGTRTKSQLGALSGYTPSGGTFANYFGTLRRNKLIKEDISGAIVITDAGLDWFGSSRPRPPATSDELLDMWRGKLLAGERKMLDVLVEKYPEAVSKEALGEKTGYTHTGGTFGNYIGTLRRNALATVDGELVKASDAIFELELEKS